jgi:uncharacterized protein
MSKTPHEILEEFPEDAEKIHAMKLENAHFARLISDYHDINRQVHLAETRAEPTDETHESELRHRRARLKDQIWQMLKAA